MINKFIRENRIVIILFLLSTIFFLIQHYVNLSWDFSAYVNNAKYWTDQGQFYEHVRAPLVPFALMLLSVFTWPLAEYVFIVLVSALFAYSSLRLARVLKLDEKLFYFLSLTPYVLLFGMINGSELLSLALFELFIVFLLEKKYYAGLLLGLAFLARYNLAVFLPLLLAGGSVKNIIKNIIAFAVPVVIWLAYNFYATRNMFTAFADTYALIFRLHDAVYPPNLAHIAYATLFLTPFFVYGIYTKVSRMKISMKSMQANKIPLIFFFILLLSLYQYFVNPVKDIRYVFMLALPVAYFSAVTFSRMKKKTRAIAIKILITLTIIFTALMLSNPEYYEPKEKYYEAMDYMKTHNLSACRTSSNSWPLMNYLGKTTEYPPREDMVNEYINEGYLLVVFPGVQEPAWAKNITFLKKLPAIYESPGFSILGKNCVPERVVNSTYMERLHAIVLFQRNLSLNTNPCFTLFRDTLEKACNWMNDKGFTADENRVDAAELDKYVAQQA